MKRNRLLYLVLLLPLLALTAAFFAQTPAALAQTGGNLFFLPLIHAPGTAIPLPPPDEASERLTVPPGFAIRIFAQNLSNPRLMAVGPDGWVYVAMRGAGQIVRLPDRNKDGLADGIEIAAQNLNQPHNLEWFNEAMYVAEVGRVSRLRDLNQDGLYEERVTVTDNIPGGGGHSSRTLHFGPDGKLYVSAGSVTNIGPENDPRRATIMRFNPDGSIPADNPFASDADQRKRAVWATGLRNSVDFLWGPGNVLWANHNGSDGLGNDLPPEELIIPVSRGTFHGWPYCYTPVLGLNLPTQPEVRDTRVDLPNGVTCTQAVPALLTTLAHAAPLGMTSGANAAFPAAYTDDLFVALHGSWNTDNSNIRDCKVERVLLSNGQVTGSETFINGWRAPGKTCGDSATWGRPAGVVVGADGALYISDDKNGRIFRVIATNP
jgi:glucose/arabinose dehydrogenase